MGALVELVVKERGKERTERLGPMPKIVADKMLEAARLQKWFVSGKVTDEKPIL